MSRDRPEPSPKAIRRTGPLTVVVPTNQPPPPPPPQPQAQAPPPPNPPLPPPIDNHPHPPPGQQQLVPPLPLAVVAGALVAAPPPVDQHGPQRLYDVLRRDLGPDEGHHMFILPFLTTGR